MIISIGLHFEEMATFNLAREIMRTKTLPPYAPALIESTRSIGYSLESAVADIIDNSIAAQAAHVQVEFFPLDGAYIAILDDGCGMCAEELDQAMQDGSRSPIEKRAAGDLGRFGLGLKTASLSQCRCLTVISKRGEEIQGRRWDIDHVQEAGDWSLIVLNQSEIQEVPHIGTLTAQPTGTLVVWQKLDRLQLGEINFSQTMGQKMDKVRAHLALVYHRYLKGEQDLSQFELNINGISVMPADPFLIQKSTQAMDDESLIVHGQKIIVRTYILPHLSRMSTEEIQSLGGADGLRRSQGFYIYRNKRLLVWGTWFRMIRKGDLSKLARVQVDIPNTLDDLWTLDIKKSAAIPPAEVRGNLAAVIARIAEKSKRTWTFRGKREISDTAVHIWNRLKTTHGGYTYEVNREHPMVRQIILQEPKLKKLLEALLRQIAYGLPLNQLYVDFNNDEQLTNGMEQTDKEIEDALRAMVEMTDGAPKRLSAVAALKSIEPFSRYPNVIERIEKELRT